MSRATTDLFEITELAHHGPEDFSVAVLTILGSFFFLLTIRWELAVIVIVALPLMIFIVIASRRSLSNSSIAVKETTAEINAGLESSSLPREWQAFSVFWKLCVQKKNRLTDLMQ